MFSIPAQNPFAVVPDETLCRVFQNLGFQGLVSCSFVCQRFYDCSNDTCVWRWVASKHPKTRHIAAQTDLSGLAIKQSVLSLFRKMVTDQHKKGSDFFFLEQSLPDLKSCEKPLGITLPFKFRDKHYLIHGGEEEIDVGDGYCAHEKWSDLEIKDVESNETEQRIRLKGIVDTSCPVATDGRIFIYLHTTYPWGEESKKIKLVWLTSIEDNEKTLIKEPPENYSLEIKKGVICLTGDNKATNINYGIIPLATILWELKLVEENDFNNPRGHICVLREYVPLTEKVPREFICSKTGVIMMEPVQCDDKQWIEKDTLPKEKLQATLDKGLQAQILEWLKREVFENQLDQLPDLERFTIGSELSRYLNRPNNPYSESSAKNTLEQAKILALHHHLYYVRHTSLIPDPLSSFHLKPKLMEAFAKLPPEFQQEIYSHLCEIQGRESSVKLGEDAFHGRNGASATIAEKLEAVRRCMNEAELDALSYL
jgi:hypothetical protein